MNRLLLALVLVSSPLSAQAPPVPLPPSAAQPSADRIAAAEAFVAASLFDEQTKEASNGDEFEGMAGLDWMIEKTRHSDGSALTADEVAQAKAMAREEFSGFLPDTIARLRRAMIDRLATEHSAEQLRSFAARPDADKHLKQFFNDKVEVGSLMEKASLKAELERRWGNVDKRLKALASSR